MDEASLIPTYSPADWQPSTLTTWQRGTWLIVRVAWDPTQAPRYGRSASLRDPQVHVLRWYYRARHVARPQVETLGVWYCGKRSSVVRTVRRPRHVCPDCLAAVRSGR